ncbi:MULTISPECIES: hypothetical protein [Acidiphilium]|uniref:Antitoxin Xre/MbcA/ParS-like toxin-binding domain-containing protein n=1 Tax=Acidiphilium rubrum TaxID=526 RepID=A0A8G2FHM0_ACIRU|nr:MULTISPECIES: hypothetical protein [Acidiphilium]MBW4036932.1 XRE family transcriptional regulator [Pseudomonadota bacterium]SIR44742.1 hypothetical protein SAMN05421828_13328 [Acidiphilium rubrum]
MADHTTSTRSDKGQGGFLAEVFSPSGDIQLDRFTQLLRVTKTDLAFSIGLSREAISKSARFNAPATQARLRETAEILNRILPWCGSVPQAFSWFRSQPIPAFGGITSEDLVRSGRIADLKDYLAGLAAGGFA